MRTMKKRIVIKLSPGGCDIVAVCPQCGENLFPADLEGFPQCPYCNYLFERDAALEDFIAAPLLRQWAGAVSRRNSRF
ncbi:MAG: hypothetical protein MJ016_07010 [Victivallaceae bacterium]|nr:hypothetical protein [Victivallaceae bacterium]